MGKKKIWEKQKKNKKIIEKKKYGKKEKKQLGGVFSYIYIFSMKI